MKEKVWAFLLGAFVSLVWILSGTALANGVPPYRPGWWDNADAQVIFDPIPCVGEFGSGTAGGSQGFDYQWMTHGSEGDEFLLLRLDNLENQELTKLFWVAGHFSYYAPGTEGILEITGYFLDGTISTITPDEEGQPDVTLVDGWFWWEPSMFPQPDRETFLIQLADNGLYKLDYLEVGTYCVPIPSSLLLLAGGLVGLLGIHRKRAVQTK